MEESSWPKLLKEERLDRRDSAWMKQNKKRIKKGMLTFKSVRLAMKK